VTWNMVWIRFNTPCVREFLEREGYVYTVRYYAPGVPSQAFVREAISYGRSIDKVKLETVCELPLDPAAMKQALAPYVAGSGFNTVEDWVEAIQGYYSKRPKLFLLIARTLRAPGYPKDLPRIRRRKLWGIGERGNSTSVLIPKDLRQRFSDVVWFVAVGDSLIIVNSSEKAQSVLATVEAHKTKLTRILGVSAT